MKKAYNVYEKTSIPTLLRSISLALVFGVCFLGFQTQLSAQAGNPDAISASHVDQSDIKALYNDFDLSSTSAEDALLRLKEYGYALQATVETTTIGELEQVVSMSFMQSLSTRLQKGSSVSQAVVQSYTETMGSSVVVNNKQYFDADRTLRGVVAILD